MVQDLRTGRMLDASRDLPPLDPDPEPSRSERPAAENGFLEAVKRAFAMLRNERSALGVPGREAQADMEKLSPATEPDRSRPPG